MSDRSEDLQVKRTEPGSRVLRRGDRGEDVRLLQQLLGVDDDGRFGEDTERAVKELQVDAALDDDGVVGADTWRAILGSTAESDPDLGGQPVVTVGTPVLVPVEDPGGGRIQDKRDPAQKDLVTVIGYRGKKVELHRLSAQAWLALVEAARADGLEDPLLLPVSGYRSLARQQQLWDQAVSKYGSEMAARRWVARPGGSPHHSGRAVDCWLGTAVGSENVDRQRETAAWAWLVAHAEDFGFYPYSAEPWHWEYNPPQN